MTASVHTRKSRQMSGTDRQTEPMNETQSGLVPSKGIHSVQQVTLAVEFVAPVTSEVLDKLRQHYDATEGLKKWFQRKTEQHAQAAVLTEGKVDVKEGRELQGITFERVAADEKVEWNLTVTPSAAYIICANYTRWKAVSEQSVVLLTDALSVMADAKIGIVGIQYVDEFYWTGEKEAFSADMVFDRNSPFLPRSVFECSPAWHNHSGWYEMVQEPKPCNVLTNMNVNMFDQQNRIASQIITLHRVSLPTQVSAPEISTLRPYYDRLHDLNKEQLKQLLSAAASELIKLGGKHAP